MLLSRRKMANRAFPGPAALRGRSAGHERTYQRRRLRTIGRSASAAISFCEPAARCSSYPYRSLQDHRDGCNRREKHDAGRIAEDPSDHRHGSIRRDARPRSRFGIDCPEGDDLSDGRALYCGRSPGRAAANVPRHRREVSTRSIGSNGSQSSLRTPGAPLSGRMVKTPQRAPWNTQVFIRRII